MHTCRSHASFRMSAAEPVGRLAAHALWSLGTTGHHAPRVRAVSQPTPGLTCMRAEPLACSRDPICRRHGECAKSTQQPPLSQSLPPLTSEGDIALTQTSSELTVGHSPMEFTSTRRMYQLLMCRTTLLTPHQATAPTLEPIVLWAPQGAAAQQGTARGDSAAQRDAFPRVSRTVFRRRHAGGRTGTSV